MYLKGKYNILMKSFKITIIFLIILFPHLIFCQKEKNYSAKEKLKQMYAPDIKNNSGMVFSYVKYKNMDKTLIKRQVIITIAKSLIGIPYWPSDNPEEGGIDCSGLVYYSYMKARIKIPRTVYEQYKAAKIIPMTLAQKGDLLFFSTFAPGPTHVGIYIGNGKFIHAPSATKCVQIDSIYKPYWNQHFISAGTFFKIYDY